MPKRRFKRHSVTQPSDPSYRIIPLTRGQNALVDTNDYDWLNQWNWSVVKPSGTYYAAGQVSGVFCYMHRFILGCQTGEEADHRNHNTLDNRRCNLRKCTSAQNKWNIRIGASNSSGYKGVSWDKSKLKWSSKISLNDKTINLGRFERREDAAKAYDARAVELFGEFAHVNFPTVPE